MIIYLNVEVYAAEWKHVLFPDNKFSGIKNHLIYEEALAF